MDRLVSTTNSSDMEMQETAQGGSRPTSAVHGNHDLANLPGTPDPPLDGAELADDPAESQSLNMDEEQDQSRSTPSSQQELIPE